MPGALGLGAGSGRGLNAENPKRQASSVRHTFRCFGRWQILFSFVQMIYAQRFESV
ncbi:Protein of unknown function [Pyronema omphalodes CBS 100304]|uniref:Uncharacterized protein n=1 Tax=Pyronema omphalodes (strain CBS 100304) TaxID=1076935 RepID=U4LK51_PYROM|nr:Protein of unknown function [Pyronema omphalodes CBS 100304]